MSRLIDVDEAIINFGFEYEDIPPTHEEFVAFLKRQKNIDAVPVVHGDWIITEEYSTTLECNCWMFTCSACKDYTISLYRRREQSYCPNCGAKMDGERRADNEKQLT